jgi:hypothetical protein
VCVCVFGHTLTCNGACDSACEPMLQGTDKCIDWYDRSVDFDFDGRSSRVFSNRQSAMMYQYLYATVPAWRGVVSLVARRHDFDIAQGAISNIELKKVDREYLSLSYSTNDIAIDLLHKRINEPAEAISKMPMRCWRKLAVKVVFPHREWLLRAIPPRFYQIVDGKVPAGEPVVLLYVGPELDRYRTRHRKRNLERVNDPLNEFVVENPMYCARAATLYRKQYREVGSIQLELVLNQATLEAWRAKVAETFAYHKEEWYL